MNKRLASSLIIASLLAGCSSHGATTQPVPPGSVATSAITGAGQTATVVFNQTTPAVTARKQASTNFVISIPAPLKVAYISAATRSVMITVSGSVSPTIANVTPGSTTTMNVVAYAGSNTFTVSLFDANNASGNLLATAQVTQNLSATSANIISLTTAGVVKSIQLGFGSASLAVGTAATFPLIVTAKDASGEIIVGPYSSPITLSKTDPAGIANLSTTTLNSSSDTATISYNGGSGAVSVNATTTDVINATTTTLTPAGGPSPSPTASPTPIPTATPTPTPTPVPALGLLNSFSVNPDGKTTAVTGVAINGGNILISEDYSGTFGTTNFAIVVCTRNGACSTQAVSSTGFGFAGNHTSGIAAFGSNAYVSALKSNIFTEIGSSLTAGAAITKGTDIATDSSGNVYVADNGVVRRFTPNLSSSVSLVMSAGTANAGIGLDAQNNLFLIDGTAVDEYDSSGNFVKTVGAAAGLSAPVDVAVDSNGDIYVLDSTNIKRLDSNGNLLATFGTFTGPSSIAIDHNADSNGSTGDIYVTDSASGTVSVFKGTH